MGSLNQTYEFANSNLVDTQEHSRIGGYYLHDNHCEVSTTADRLEIAMKEAGIDQSALARAIGVTQGAISLIVLGKTRVSKHLPAIARHLGVSHDWLAGHDVAKSTDVLANTDLRPVERSLLTRFRSLTPNQQGAVELLASAMQPAPLDLPDEDVLAEVFDTLLLASKGLERGELARELAKQLPKALELARAPLVRLSPDDLDDDQVASDAPERGLASRRSGGRI